MAGPSNSGSGDLFELSDRSRSRTFTISPPAANLDLNVTSTAILPFGVCNVIMHKVYYGAANLVNDKET